MRQVRIVVPSCDLDTCSNLNSRCLIPSEAPPQARHAPYHETTMCRCDDVHGSDAQPCRGPHCTSVSWCACVLVSPQALSPEALSPHLAKPVMLTQAIPHRSSPILLLLLQIKLIASFYRSLRCRSDQGNRKWLSISPST